MQHERASKRQQELLSFVDGFIKGNGYGPSYREIMRALGYKSVSTVAIHIDGLIAKGYLARRDNSARSLEVISLQPDAPSRKELASDDLEKNVAKKIKALQLTDDQRDKIAEVCDLLGFESIASDMRRAEDEG